MPPERRLRCMPAIRLRRCEFPPTIDRRRLIGSAALAPGALLLAGLRDDHGATAPRSHGRLPAAGQRLAGPGHPHRRRACGPIAPPASSSAPRRSGDKRLVHNYGHGGAGITLCWGTSKLAAELGLPGHQGPVAVIGAGRDGAHHRAAGPGSGLSGHDLRQGAAARHDLQHRRRPMAARSAIIATAR